MDGDITGALTALCAVMKHGKREDLVEDAPNILTSLLAANFKESSNTNIRKSNFEMSRIIIIFACVSHPAFVVIAVLYKNEESWNITVTVEALLFFIQDLLLYYLPVDQISVFRILL